MERERERERESKRKTARMAMNMQPAKETTIGPASYTRQQQPKKKFLFFLITKIKAGAQHCRVLL